MQTDWIAQAQNEAIVDIGQIPDTDRRKLNAMAKKGHIAKWFGHWDTFSPEYGMGRVKTCFGPIGLRDAYCGYSRKVA